MRASRGPARICLIGIQQKHTHSWCIGVKRYKIPTIFGQPLTKKGGLTYSMLQQQVLLPTLSRYGAEQENHLPASTPTLLLPSSGLRQWHGYSRHCPGCSANNKQQRVSSAAIRHGARQVSLGNNLTFPALTSYQQPTKRNASV